MPDSQITSCPIWDTDIQSADWIGNGYFEYLIHGSDRVGCDYRITRDATLILGANDINGVSDKVRARLNTLLIDVAEQLGEPSSLETYPAVDRYLIEQARSKPSLGVTEKLTRLLKWLNTPPIAIGAQVLVAPGPEMYQALAHTECLDPTEVIGLAIGLADAELINLPHGGQGNAFSCSITVQGMMQLENLTSSNNPGPTIGFDVQHRRKIGDC